MHLPQIGTGETGPLTYLGIGFHMRQSLHDYHAQIHMLVEVHAFLATELTQFVDQNSDP